MTPTAPNQSGSVRTEPAPPPKPDKAAILNWHRVPRNEGVRGLLVTGSLTLSLGLLTAAVYYDWLWAVAPLALVAGYAMHTHLIALHEAAHGNIRKNRIANELNGFILGAGGFMSLALYRAAHHTHHAHLATERDEELWPFTHTQMPRWKRRLVAFVELTCGLVYTPILFLRSFLRKGTLIREPHIRRRIWAELFAIAAIWAVIVAVAVAAGWTKYLLLCFFLPAWIAGNIQSLRKYVEHLGMTGATTFGLTRSVVPLSWPEWLFSYSMFHEMYHGIHHKYPKIPAGVLPEAAGVLPDEPPPFRSFAAATWHMIKTLGDPRTGSQWNAPANRHNGGRATAV